MTFRISYSSSNTFQGCNRKFYYDKVLQAQPDPDYVDNSAALRLGKAFHQVLEECLHRRDKLKEVHFQNAFDDNDIISDTEIGYIYAMVNKYLDLHIKSGLDVKTVEIEIGNEKYIGYVDAIMIDRNGNWWIVDLKTASSLSNSLLSRLSRDPQLNVYAYFRDQIARHQGLDLASFSGVRYRVTTKPRYKMSKRETREQFIERCKDSIESYDIGIPYFELVPDKVYAHLMRLHAKALEMSELPEERISQNFTFCESYFKPCPFWSRCYGTTFSEAREQHRIFDSTDMVDLTLAVSDDLDYL